MKCIATYHSTIVEKCFGNRPMEISIARWSENLLLFLAHFVQLFQLSFTPFHRFGLAWFERLTQVSENIADIRYRCLDHSWWGRHLEGQVDSIGVRGLRRRRRDCYHVVDVIESGLMRLAWFLVAVSRCSEVPTNEKLGREMT